MRDKYANMKMYVRCSDPWGNKNNKDYVVDLCISSGPDKTQPVILATDPVNNAYLKKDVTNLNITAYVSEPAECRYDYSNTKTYNEMNHSMDCETDIASASVNGWPCVTNWNGLTNADNTMYIKCKDQPWLPSVNDSLRNIGDSYKYSLYGTSTDLRITSTSPSGTVYGGIEPFTLNISVETSGGAMNGNAMCKLGFVDYDSVNIPFFETGGTLHRQNGLQFLSGNYSIYVKCTDDADNEARGNVTFNLKLDSGQPMITRVYKQGGRIIVMTNENARCAYKTDNCNFEIENATSMDSSLSLQHSASADAGQILRVKCKDEWGNKNPDCGIVVSSSQL
jgi:hypothetical protein